MDNPNYETPAHQARAESALKQAYANQANMAKEQCCIGAAREMTVGEAIDRQIYEAHRMIRALTGIKGALSTDFLNSGASRVAPAWKF